MELSRDHQDRRPTASSEIEEWNRIAMYESGLGWVGDETLWLDAESRAATRELLAEIAAWLRSLVRGPEARR